MAHVGTAFFAHTSGADKAGWEPLTDHLALTARLAEGFARPFGLGDLAGLAGLLHDLGKYQPEFQARLNGAVDAVDHSGHGAAHARAAYGLLGQLIAHGIAGHHAGLRDGLLSVGGRLDGKVPTLAPVVEAARGDGLIFPPMPAMPRMRPSSAPGFQLAFLIRMLFSCLVDADFLATEDFYVAAEGRPKPDRGASASVTDLARALDRHMARFPSPQPGALNARRAEILTHARGLAAKPPGVFTLTVPTGGGKTLTSLAFALEHARRNDLDRVIVGIPFTSVIEQTAQVYRHALAPHAGAILEHHSAFDQSPIARDGGEGGKQARSKLSLAMETWDQPLIVTTTVRLFESLFSNRPSQCRKLHNLARSVIVLDEVQTLPLALLRPCVAALKELAANYGCSIVLCTATQPALLKVPVRGGRAFTDGFEDTVELAPDPPALFDAMRRVRVETIGEQADRQIADRLSAVDQVLCVVNRRAHAQALYEAIRDQPGARHLSTLMCAAHRRAVLAEIRDDLKAGRPCRVISTSLIEAGVDVDFPLVFRAEAGLDSILQAAGRCNREGRRDAEASRTLVFRPADGKRPQSMKAPIESGETVFRRFGDDVARLDAVALYFDELLYRKGDAALDEQAIMRLCHDHMNTLNFPFETIADRFRMIDDYNQPVIVAWDDEARAAITALRHLPDGFTPGGVARCLQGYTVGVPPKARQAMIANGAAQIVDEARYGDQFVVLANPDLYRADVGLSWADPTLMDAERLML